MPESRFPHPRRERRRAYGKSTQIEVTGAVVSFNGRAGIVSLLTGDVTGALGYTPLNPTAIGVTIQAFDATTTKNAAVQTLTNKTFALGTNTLTGTKTQFDTAVTDGNFIYAGDNLSMDNITVSDWMDVDDLFEFRIDGDSWLSLAAANANQRTLSFHGCAIDGDADCGFITWPKGIVTRSSTAGGATFYADEESALSTTDSGGQLFLSQSGASPTGADQIIGRITFSGKHTSGANPDNPVPMTIWGVSEGSWTATSWPSAFVFRTTPSGSIVQSERLRVNGAGIIVTGTANITGALTASNFSGSSSGTNTGDQSSIVGITGTKAQFDTAVTDGNILYTDTIGVSVQAFVTAGTTAQYWRGDKSWQTLDKTAVGLGNVDNTSDANKPVSTAQATAIGLKANDADVVKLTGAQTVAGVKTFSSNPSLTGGGVTFPATQVPSADANTLDDYEEGTFTPAVAFGGASSGITYNAATTGRYTKIGRLVFYEIVVILTNKGVSTGTATVTGLPFTAATALPQMPGSFIPFSMTAAAIVSPLARVQNNTTTIVLYNFNGTTATALTETAFTNSSILNLAGCYTV